MSTSVTIPGEGYDPDSIYTVPVSGSYNGIYESRCSWPFVEVQVKYTVITTTDPVPAKPGQPYIPPTLPKEDLNENAGWGNSSARSAQPLLRSQRFKTNPGFDIRGFFVGLAIYGKEKSHPSVFPVGLSCIQAGVFVVENGSIKSSLSASINPDDEISIEFYSNGSIVYRHSNGNSYYSSASVGNPVYIYAQGYQAQDVLLSSLIEDFISYDPAPSALAAQESIGTAGISAGTVPAVLAVQESIGTAGAKTEAAPAAFAVQESIGSAGVDIEVAPAAFAVQESIGSAGTDAEAAPAVLAAQETFGMARNSFPVPAAFAAQESVGVAGHFLAAQETIGMTGSGRILAVQETVGSAIPCFFNPVHEITAVQETVGEADEKYNLHCNIFGECLTVAGLSNDDYCAISGITPCGDSFINNDDVPPRLNSAGFLIMPDTGAIDGGGMIETCEIIAEDFLRSSLSDVDNYCAIGGFDGAQKAELKNSPAGYLWTDDTIKIKESSSFLRDVLINLYSSLEFVDGLNIFKDIAVGLIENNLIYDANDIIADKDILLEETCSLLDSLKININGLPDYTGGTAWVINMETGATSLFLDYDYNSFMTSQAGEVYGICKDGIYLLNGTGASVPMSAIDYGIHRFGSETKKMIPHFYASVASTGRLILKLTVGECEYEYYAMSSSEYLDKHRIKIGKGIDAGKGGIGTDNRFIFANPVLIAPEGTEIKELETLEYLPVAFDRRK